MAASLNSFVNCLRDKATVSLLLHNKLYLNSWSQKWGAVQNPPTAVGGIFRLFAQSLHWRDSEHLKVTRAPDSGLPS
jgi:hypothetical protein